MNYGTRPIFVPFVKPKRSEFYAAQIVACVAVGPESVKLETVSDLSLCV